MDVVEDVGGANILMVLCSMVFGGIVSKIGVTALPVDVELSSYVAIFEPIKRMSMAFERFCLMDEVTMPCAVVLLVCMGVGG